MGAGRPTPRAKQQVAGNRIIQIYQTNCRTKMSVVALAINNFGDFQVTDIKNGVEPTREVTARPVLESGGVRLSVLPSILGEAREFVSS